VRPWALAILALLASEARAAPRARPGGALRLLLPGPPGELDPARAASAADLIAARALHAGLLELDPSGALRPGLAEALPEISADGRELRLRLRPGLRFQDGAPVTAADAVESLARLLRPETGSPHGWIAAAIEGAEAVREGRARVPAGLQAPSDRELRVQLAFPFPGFARALASAPASVVHPGNGLPSGAGPFRMVARAPELLRLAAYAGHHRGRPWAEGLVLSWPDAPAAARQLARGEAELALRPEAIPGLGVRDEPLFTAVVIALNARRLGPAAEAVAAQLEALDRAELARLLRGPGRALPWLLPPAASGPSAPRTSSRIPAAAPPPGLTLLAPASLRAIADRIQVKLFDRGVRVAVESVADSSLAARLAAGAHDAALVPVALASDDPRLALAQLGFAIGGPARGARLLRELPAVDASGLAALAARAEEELHAVPIAAAGLRASARPALQGLWLAPDGSPDLGDLWLLPDRPRAP
jgi:MarR-like DNA-binding transcriptional regulator SgrR of sgrS sRNA